MNLFQRCWFALLMLILEWRLRSARFKTQTDRWNANLLHLFQNTCRGQHPKIQCYTWLEKKIPVTTTDVKLKIRNLGTGKMEIQRNMGYYSLKEACWNWRREMSKTLLLLSIFCLAHFLNVKVTYPAILIPGNKISWDPVELNLLSSVVSSAIIFPIASIYFPKFNLKIRLRNVSNYLQYIPEWCSDFYIIFSLSEFS